ncbi:centromere protein C isoform X2 [Melanerpes formicivorus]|uniref:centromere protein C isoform X2 n=1 Tax=Melanerpes formicivorus TaxID=211600 RepID=UPI00358E197F
MGGEWAVRRAGRRPRFESGGSGAGAAGPLGPGMAAAQNHFKKEYRPRFCCGEGKKIDIQPGQNILKAVLDCFESCDDNITICSPSATRCSTPVVQNEKRTSIHSQRPKAGLKEACNPPESLPASPLKAVRSRERSREATLKPGTCDYVAVSKKTESPVSKGEASNRLGDVDILCISPAVSSDSEDDHGSVKSPLPLEEPKPSPEHVLCFDDQNSPAGVNIHLEVENLEGPQTGRDKNAVLVQERESNAKSPAKRNSFSSAVLAAVARGTLGKRYSAPISSSPSPPPPSKEDEDVEIEDECDFLIDELDDRSSKLWFSIPRKSNKLKKDTPATPVSKPQPSRKKTESRKEKRRKVQAEVPTEQQADGLDVRVLDFRGASESEADCNSEGKVLKSPRQSRETEKDALRQGTPKQKEERSRKRGADKLLLPQPELETQASDAEQCKTRGTPDGDSLVPSAGHQQEQTVSPRKKLKSSKNLQSASKSSQRVAPKKQTAKQKPPKAPVAKRAAESPRKKLKISAKKSSNKKRRVQREENSDSEPGEEELEREPAKPAEEVTSLPHQKLQTPTSQQLTKSENILQVLESLDDATNRSLVQALQCLIDSVKSSEVKQLPAKSSEKVPQKLRHRDSEGAFSGAENAVSHTRSDSTSRQGTAREKQKLADVKVRSTKRKRHAQRGPHGPFLEDGDGFPSGWQCSEQDSLSPDVPEDLDFQARALLSNKSTNRKIVLPSNTPNMRRTKRIRLKPLEYWRGERVNYEVGPSGNLVVTGVVCPETEPQTKIKHRKDGDKQKRAKRRKEKPPVSDHSLGDTAKPTIVLDPVTNEEVHLDCVTTGMCHSCFFKDETVEIYKHLNTSAFATGKLVLKPLKEKGHQFVHMDTIVFHVIYGKIITTLHKTSYYLTTGDYFYVPAGNRYNIRNLLDEESVLLFTQLKKDR